MVEVDKKVPPPTLRSCLRKRRQLQPSWATLHLPGREWEPRHATEKAEAVGASAARLKNPRWRLPAVDCQVCLEELPASFRLLAEAPAEATAAARQQSLQYRAALPPSVWRPSIEQPEAAPEAPPSGSVAWEVTEPAAEEIAAVASATPAIQTPGQAPEDSHAAQEAALPRIARRVSFRESVGLEEVVLVHIPNEQRLRPLPSPAKRGEPRVPTAEECAWANLAHIADNQKHVMGLFTECFSCFKGLKDWRAARRLQRSHLPERSP